jgi:hypothetical protein
MSKYESQSAYARMLSLMTSYAREDRKHCYYHDGKRGAIFYHSGTTYNVLELRHGEGLHLKLEIHRVPPDDANLEFANTIMDAAERIAKLGQVGKP